MAFVTKLFLRRPFSTSSKLQSTIKEFVVIGGGQMGSGIAQVGAQTGHKVTIVDVSQDVLDKSKSRINEGIYCVYAKHYSRNLCVWAGLQ